MKNIVIAVLVLCVMSCDCGPNVLVDAPGEPVAESDAGNQAAVDAGEVVDVEPTEVEDAGLSNDVNPGCFKGRGHKYGLFKHGKCD